MSKLQDPLKTTAPVLHRFYVAPHGVDSWYAIMRECRRMFGRQWSTQPRTRRRLRGYPRADRNLVWAWFDVPDPAWATWVATKFAVLVTADEPGK
jgi:hypothetical protein